jgi:hypothetical protein
MVKDFRVIVILESHNGLLVSSLEEIDREKNKKVSSSMVDALVLVETYRNRKEEVIRFLQQKCLDDFLRFERERGEIVEEKL